MAVKSSLHSFLVNPKTFRTHEYICCTYDELWTHLEKQFKEGMTRENRGKVWHIDHRIPLSWFEKNGLNDETNLKIMWHYGNLQPLFVLDNLSKGDKMPTNPNFKY